MESLEEIPKKVQYLNIDSDFVVGKPNDFHVDFGITSNIFLQEMKDVIGIKVVDFFVTQVGVSDSGTLNAAKYIDLYCEDIPLSGQILDERNGQLLARFPIERNFSGSSNLLLHDKQWKSFNRKTNYFNPISIKKLHFKLYELQGDGDYFPIQPTSKFFFTLEVTTIDHKAPPKDTNLRVVRAIEKLCKKVDALNENVVKIPKSEPKKKIPLSYVIIPTMIIFAMYFFMKPKSQPQPMMMPPRPAI